MMFKNILLGISMVLFSLNSLAQDPPYPGWLWAKSGGSTSSISGDVTNDYGWERIVDLTIDSDNNYYFLAEVGGFSFMYDGMNYNTFNTEPQRRDIFIFSTDVNGNFRWKKIIGGGIEDRAASIGIDEGNNVYVSGTTLNVFGKTSVHFDNDSIMNEGTSTPGPNNKKAFIIKYNNEGEFQWLQQPEGEEIPTGASASVVKTLVEPNGISHSLVWFGEGTHLNGQLTVDANMTVDETVFKMPVIVKYSADGTLINFIPLYMKPRMAWPYNYQMAYDANLDRYYIADTYRAASDPSNPLSINGYGIDTPNKGFYLAAVSSEGEVMWYHESHLYHQWAIGDLELDAFGNVYLTGWTAYTDSFAGYIFDMESPHELKAPFLLKFNSDGNLLWGTNAEGGSPFPGHSIVIAGNDVYLGLGMTSTIWNDIQIPKEPWQGLSPDVVIMRFDATTGIAQEVIHVQDTPTRDVIMAMEMDSEGALVVGGYFNGLYLFYGAEFQLQNSGFDADFFIAKYQTPHNPVGGIADVNPKSVRIYPNPTTGILNLQSDERLTAYTLYDLRGKMVSRGSLNTGQVDMTGMDAGVYILEITTWDNVVERYKVVRE